VLLLAAQGRPTAAIAAELASCADTVRKWRRRWNRAPGLASLADAKRSGRPAVFTPMQIAQVKGLACRPVADSGVPLVVPGPGPLGYRRQHLPGDLIGDRASVARRGCDQTLATVAPR